ncbi:MAG: hemolysin III family protein [Eubacterium sp.]|nr:hemolysin III family protein [Eubacterium sp.]
MKKRIKLADRVLPDYTKGEEIFNMVSHIVGGALGIAALVLCIIVAASHHSAISVISAIIYGVTLISLYTMSSIYHGLRPGMAKKVFQVLDHCTIYFLIAGSYTPFLLVALLPKYPVISWFMFGVVWGCAIVACTLTAIDLEKYAVFSMICYLTMGWIIIIFVRQVYDVIGAGGITFLVTGGVSYTVGSIFYGLGNTKKWMHSIFHLFILAGSILHFFAIIFYAL